MTAALSRRRVAAEAELRAALLRFLAVNERPDEWTFFQPRRGPAEGRGASPDPDIVIEAAGRVAYVEVLRQDGGPLPGPRRLHGRLAQRRGAPVFVVRSVPDLERALGSLGIRLRPRGRLSAAPICRERKPTMALSRKARLKRSSAAGCEPRAVPPTPQTRAKLRRDVIATLLDKGQLGQPHAEAAAEIRTVFEAVGRGMFPASRLGIDTAALPERRKAGHDFLDRMSAGECRAWERRYLPWTKALALTIASGLPGVRWLQLVLDVVIDNASLREVERRYRLRHGTAIEYLRQGLEIYGR